MTSLLEQLADVEHEQWRHWAVSVLGSEDISPERANRWSELDRPYSALTEEEKEKDRMWARRVMEIIIQYMETEVSE